MARVLRTSHVAALPAGAALHERSLPLTYRDAVCLHRPLVEGVFFYPDATSDVLSNLTDSLSNALAAFYPLSGRLRLTPGTHNRYELHYQPGDSVTFTVAEYDNHHVGFEEHATDDLTEVAKIVPLVLPIPEGGAVLAMKATVLRGGLATGVTVHHAACDGVSSTHFQRTWVWSAAACSGAGAPEPPFVDRSIICPRDTCTTLSWRPGCPVMTMTVGNPPIRPLSSSSSPRSRCPWSTCRASKKRSPARRNALACCRLAPHQSSRRSASSGNCYIRAKPGTDGKVASSCGGRAYFVLPADHRTRLEPPVPDEYLGNCLGPCIASAPRMDVAAAGVDGSPRFRVYDTDFGFGRPAKVDVVSVARTSAMAVAKARSGSDGVEVGISLSAGAMEHFNDCFADAIACLLS
ncbi:hypothetical protein CFC21_025331 [Triticum aestivum]|uniref:Uncharacterized protein n=1 Tax=Triticum aestivum TaxID=4565 RepID=A0A9R1EIP4_WHEAT|nr:hypothetical protein CFC21_025331 [Triticum aestivum]